MSAPRIAAPIFVAAAVLIAAGGVVFGTWDHDGGFFLLHGAYAGEGLRPYVDYPSIYPPLIDLLTAGAVYLPIERLWIAVLLPIAWIFAVCAATAALAYAVTRDGAFSLLLGGLYALFATANGGNHLTLEHGVALFGTLAFAAAIAERPFLAGLFAACATLSKQNGLLVFVPLIALVSRRDLVRVVAGAAIPCLLIAVWIRDIPAMFRACVSDVSTYSRQAADSPPLSTELVRSPETLLLFAIVVVAAVMLRSRIVVWLALVCAVLEFLPRVVRNYPHYTINLWPFLALILAMSMTARMRAAIATCAAIVLMLVVARSQWHTPSPLLTVFAAAAERVAAVTPPNERVRQYGAEPIIEFLANRKEDVLNKPALPARWDGSGVYSTPPSSSTTVVVIDRGQPWVRGVVADLYARGFVNVGVFGRIGIFRSRSASDPDPARSPAPSPAPPSPANR